MGAALGYCASIQFSCLWSFEGYTRTWQKIFQIPFHFYVPKNKNQFRRYLKMSSLIHFYCRQLRLYVWITYGLKSQKVPLNYYCIMIYGRGVKKSVKKPLLAVISSLIQMACQKMLYLLIFFYTTFTLSLPDVEVKLVLWRKVPESHLCLRLKWVFASK